ncbi:MULTISPECIES: preprotein translocase subunit YajC [unclassified Lacticaseibacillus]|uniref:preprotein translocase subunit YajC n=1 Tax=unclassified Lacticaseibacillus TaxID=2759744 RepID=UPI001941E7A8|nr:MULTISPECIES: preprotein translocase subunit YajC [unclassified Lacticaseibacillus]
MAGSISTILMIVVMFAFFYFFMMRPQKKQQQQRQEMLSGLKKGDKIITIGGLHGVIDKIDRSNNTVDLDLDGVYLTFNLSAIRTVTPQGEKTPAPVATETAAKDATDEDKPYSEGDGDSSADDQEDTNK